MARRGPGQCFAIASAARAPQPEELVSGDAMIATDVNAAAGPTTVASNTDSAAPSRSNGTASGHKPKINTVRVYGLTGRQNVAVFEGYREGL